MQKYKSQKYNIPEMIEAIDDYLESKKKGFPILKECCLENGWSYDSFMRLQRENKELKEAAERLLMTKEVALEKGGLAGKLNTTMVVFSLKQLGWRDKVDMDVDVKDTSKGADDLDEYFKKRHEERTT